MFLIELKCPFTVLPDHMFKGGVHMNRIRHLLSEDHCIIAISGKAQQSNRFRAFDNST